MAPMDGGEDGGGGGVQGGGGWKARPRRGGMGAQKSGLKCTGHNGSQTLGEAGDFDDVWNAQVSVLHLSFFVESLGRSQGTGDVGA